MRFWRVMGRKFKEPLAIHRNSTFLRHKGGKICPPPPSSKIWITLFLVLDKQILIDYLIALGWRGRVDKAISLEIVTAREFCLLTTRITLFG